MDRYFDEDKKDRGIFYQRKDRIAEIIKNFPKIDPTKIIHFTIQPTLFCPKYPIDLEHGNYLKSGCYINKLRMEKYFDLSDIHVHIIQLSQVKEFTDGTINFLNLPTNKNN